jgi:hypothetical protein
VRAIISREDLSQSPEDIVKDMLGHTVPGVMVVVSMVAAIALFRPKAVTLTSRFSRDGVETRWPRGDVDGSEYGSTRLGDVD